MKDTGIIYSIICKVNGKRYIGQTRQELGKRWKQHLQESKEYSDRPLYRALKKYGSSMFTVRIIEENIPIDKLSERECYWIEQFDSYSNGYNATTGGEESKTIREDVRNKISKTMAGIEKSSEHIANIKKSLKGNTFKVKGDGKHHRTKIRGVHVNTGEIVEFNSITDAANTLHLKAGNLSRGIKNNYLVGEYRWEKLEDKTINHPIYGKRILDGKIIHHFNSIREAGRVLGTGGDSGIRKALKNPSLYSWKGCRWYYEDKTND